MSSATNLAISLGVKGSISDAAMEFVPKKRLHAHTALTIADFNGLPHAAIFTKILTSSARSSISTKAMVVSWIYG
jgi:hypothetical protein